MVIAKASTAVMKRIMIVKLISVCLLQEETSREIRNVINDIAAILTLDLFLVRRTGKKFIETSDRNRK